MNGNKYEQLHRKRGFAWYFHVKYFTLTIVLCLNILWLKAVSEINARQLRKHRRNKCSIEYLTTDIELVFPIPTFKSWTVHKIIEYLTSRLLSLWPLK